MWKAMALVCMIENGETKCREKNTDYKISIKN